MSMDGFLKSTATCSTVQYNKSFVKMDFLRFGVETCPRRFNTIFGNSNPYRNLDNRHPVKDCLSNGRQQEKKTILWYSSD